MQTAPLLDVVGCCTVWCTALSIAFHANKFSIRLHDLVNFTPFVHVSHEDAVAVGGQE